MCPKIHGNVPNSLRAIYCQNHMLPFGYFAYLLYGEHSPVTVSHVAQCNQPGPFSLTGLVELGEKSSFSTSGDDDQLDAPLLQAV